MSGYSPVFIDSKSTMDYFPLAMGMPIISGGTGDRIIHLVPIRTRNTNWHSVDWLPIAQLDMVCPTRDTTDDYHPPRPAVGSSTEYRVVG